MPEEAKSKVDSLDETLYSRTRYQDPLDARHSPRQADLPNVSADWGTSGLDEMLNHERKPSTATPFMKKFFYFALGFFGITMLVAAYVFFGGSTFISSKNVDIEVVGPTAVPAGDPVELQVTIKNGNNADLQLANFSIQYPQGSRSEVDSSQALTFNKEDLGVIKAGHEVVRTLKFTLIGTTREVKELKLSVEYQVKGSNATFYKDKVYQITIGSSPLAMSTNVPGSVTSGSEFTAVVSLTLNSTEVLKNAMLRVDYPYGYTFSSASPAPFSDNNVWALGDLLPGATKRIEIHGRLSGENSEERTIRFYAGVAEGDAPVANFKTTVVSIQRTVSISRPAVAITTSLNGDTSESYAAPAGQGINGDVRFVNNLPEKLLNPKLSIKLTGAALDKASVAAYINGFYDSTADTITWSVTNSAGALELAPGANGSVNFRLASLADLTALQASKGITLDVTLTGTPLGSNTPISVTDTRLIKIASQVSLNAKALHSIGVFDNRGELPPKVGQETTYAIVWTVGNTQNALTDTSVTAHLGPGVKWSGAMSSQNENISYDEPSNTVTWNLGTLDSGTGFSNPAREVSFQVSLTPSLTQVGSAPTLVTTSSLTGFETVANKNVSVTSPAVTTRLTSDPAFIQGDDIVVK